MLLTSMASMDAHSPPPVLGHTPTSLEDSVHSLLDLSSSSATSPRLENAKKQSSVVDYRPSSRANSTFGTRLLSDPSKVNDFNAWDNVEWDEEHIATAKQKVAFHQDNPVPHNDREIYSDEKAHAHWNDFYITHDQKFFKDRQWIKLEFPELIECCKDGAGAKVIADVGCAVGNTVLPLLRVSTNERLRIHALDYSAEAMKILAAHEEHDPRIVTTHVWDMADVSGPPKHIPAGSVDVVVLIFAFSALSPGQWSQAVSNMKRMLKVGGILLLRDYGRYDLTQLRLKAGRLLQDNFYIRGDKTRMYYFTNEELGSLFSVENGWNITQNAIDKRMLVNRKEGKKMYRAWVQLKAIKIA